VLGAANIFPSPATNHAQLLVFKRAALNSLSHWQTIQTLPDLPDNAVDSTGQTCNRFNKLPATRSNVPRF
jgi:hypothetical protein